MWQKLDGKLGYSSVSMVSTSSIHPSKRVVNKEGQSFSEESSDITVCSNDFESSGSEAEINDNDLLCNVIRNWICIKKEK